MKNSLALENIRSFYHKIKRRIFTPYYVMANRKKEKFECPVCGFYGPFQDISPSYGKRSNALCLRCGSCERTRLQYLVMNNIFESMDTSNMAVLHFAPEKFFMEMFLKKFDTYHTSDPMMRNVDFKADLTHLPFDDASYDFVFASHVLEHILDDKKAINEIRRILRPNGIAILPVPVVAQATIEYYKPITAEADHVRAPGLDYFERYSQIFTKVKIFSSDMFPLKYQLYVFEDRSKWPTDSCPLRLPIVGEKHMDFVPVCYAT